MPSSQVEFKRELGLQSGNDGRKRPPNDAGASIIRSVELFRQAGLNNKSPSTSAH